MIKYQTTTFPFPILPVLERQRCINGSRNMSDYPHSSPDVIHERFDNHHRCPRTPAQVTWRFRSAEIPTRACASTRVRSPDDVQFSIVGA